MGRLLQWILSNYALAALLMLAPESPVCGQNIPAFPQMIQPILDHAIHRTDIAESLLRVFTTMRGPAGIFDSLAFRHNMSVVGSGTGRPSYDSSPTVEDYGPTCKEHLSMLFKGITERKMWALKFADAVGKLPNDVLQGDLLWYGGFSSCRGISVPSLDANSSHILYQGQYCLAQIGNKTAATPTNTLTAALQLGVCMPSTCNETDTGVTS
ncbi:hypothetical protein LSH36_59g08024 [Paralvinella palmiformis]|uniref:Nose resistant-to-fluoxetine protein N-terminal domain-containing protein n=1 Tax=Paralvinella palmiformis TaxID=53620 RepID=A0AAD9K4T0_9ANNE|nr:hypothetical protein LSH36_59g08024 [Paralvinella palmiformis]